MSSIRTVSIDYGDTRFSIYLISLPGKYQTPDTATTHVMHSHFYYELHYASRGQCLYRFSDREVLLQEGQMLLIPPGQHHLSVGKDSESYIPQVLSLSISATENPGRFYPAFLSMLNAAAMKPITGPLAVAGYINILQQRPLYDCVPGICRLKAAAACFLSDLFHLLSPYATETATSAEPPCDAEVAVLLENMVNRPDITLEQIAEAINYSTRHTARLIKNIYGASLSEIRRSRKSK